MEESVDYYMQLPYEVELQGSGRWYRASVRELPGCSVSAPASESLEHLWRRLQKRKREWIGEQLELGAEIPEPARRNPLWETLPEDLDEEDVKSLLYAGGAPALPFGLLE